MDQTDPARDPDPLRHLAEAALARQEAARRQRADDQAVAARDQAAQAEAADHAQARAEAKQLAAEVLAAEGAELATGLAWTAAGTGQATATIDEHGEPAASLGAAVTAPGPLRAAAGRWEEPMDVRPVLSHELVVGDYLGVISSMHHPEHFRRVEKLEYVDADLGRQHLTNDVFYLEAARMGPVIAWCHGIAGPLILPAGDVHLWLDVPEDRRTADQEDAYWGVLSGGDAPLFSFSRLPDQTDTWQQDRIQDQQAFWQRD